MTNKTTLKKIGFASLIMMASVFASRIIGVVREMTIAGVGGIQSSVDAYQIAFILPEILNHVVASGFLSITFIPIFSHYLSLNRRDDGYRVFSYILNTFGLVLLCLIGLAMIWTPELVRIFAPGIKGPETFVLAVKMTRIIIPAQFFFFTGGLLMAIQFANEKFFIPALAPLIYNFMIILGGLFLAPYIGMEGFAWGVLAGAFVGNFALQVWGAKKLGVKYYPIFSITHPDVIDYIKLTLPLMVGLTMTFSTEILLKYFGSYLPAGSIAALNYSLRVMFILVGLFGQAIGVASYPYMAKLAQNQDLSELNALLNKTLKYIFLVIPFSVFFMAISPEIIILLFQRGQFDAQATAVTAGILPYFMAGTFAFCAQTIVSRGYYATKNTLFPALFSTVCVIGSLPMIYGLMKISGAKGVAIGLSIAVTIQTFSLYECWNKRTHNTKKGSVYRFLLKILFVSSIIAIFLFASVFGLRLALELSLFWNAFIITAITGIEFIFLLFIAGSIFKIKELHHFYTQIKNRGLSWKKK